MTNHDPLDGIDTDVLVDVLADLADPPANGLTTTSLDDPWDDRGWRAGVATLVAASRRPGEPSELKGERHVVAAMADAIRNRRSGAPGRSHARLAVPRAVAAKTITVTAVALGVATAAAAGVTVNLVVPDGGSEPRRRPEPAMTTTALEHDDGGDPGTVICASTDDECGSREGAESTAATPSTTTSLPATIGEGRADEVGGSASVPSTVEPGATADDTAAVTLPVESVAPTPPTTTEAVPLAEPGPPVDPGPPVGQGPPAGHGPPAGQGPPAGAGPPGGSGPPADPGRPDVSQPPPGHPLILGSGYLAMARYPEPRTRIRGWPLGPRGGW